jgi:hypothetical protein
MKKIKLKKLTFTFILLIAFVFTKKSFAQTSADWTLGKQSSNVKIYFKTTLCNNKETVLLKVVNRNSKTVNVNWTVWGKASKGSISINPNQEKEGTCTDSNNLTFAMPVGAAIINNSLPIEITVHN